MENREKILELEARVKVLTEAAGELVNVMGAVDRAKYFGEAKAVIEALTSTPKSEESEAVRFGEWLLNKNIDRASYINEENLRWWYINKSYTTPELCQIFKDQNKER